MQQRPKIAIVANSTWNIFNFRLSLIKELKRSGYRVIVIAPVDQYIHYLNDNYFTKHIAIKRMRAQKRNPIADFRLLLELYRIYRKEQPDLVLHFTVKPNIYGSLAAQMAGVRSVPTVTGLGFPFLNDNLKNKLIRPLYRRAFRGLSKVLFHNRDDRDLFVREKMIRPGQTMIVEGSGVDMSFFKPQPLPRQDRFIFLFVGRLLKDKGILEFVGAARQIQRIAKHAECWVVGELNTGNPSKVSKYEVLGWVSEKVIRYFGHAREIRNYISQANVLVLPSYREGLPRSVLEAMSMGKPIITTNVAGCRETVLNGTNGMLVTPRDTDALAEAMVQMYQMDEDALQRMGNASMEIVRERFDVNLINQEYLKLIKELLDPQKHVQAAPKVNKKVL
jgi:glycosyltransferase involved in cell wall biosynthesis